MEKRDQTQDGGAVAPMSRHSYHRRFSCQWAFSLIELLVVIALVALLMALAVPAFVSIAQGQGMKRAVNYASDVLELARTEAMAKSTWVWVGVSDTTGDNIAKAPEITIATVASKDGTTNTSANNLIQLAKPIRIENVTILSAPTQWASNARTLAGGKFSFSTPVAGKTKSFGDTVIGISPQGEVVLDPAIISPWIELGLSEKRGSTTITNKTASIRISGISGQVVVTY